MNALISIIHLALNDPPSHGILYDFPFSITEASLSPSGAPNPKTRQQRRPIAKKYAIWGLSQVTWEYAKLESYKRANFELWMSDKKVGDIIFCALGGDANNGNKTI